MMIRTPIHPQRVTAVIKTVRFENIHQFQARPSEINISKFNAGRTILANDKLPLDMLINDN